MDGEECPQEEIHKCVNEVQKQRGQAVGEARTEGAIFCPGRAGLGGSGVVARLGQIGSEELFTLCAGEAVPAQEDLRRSRRGARHRFFVRALP